MEFQVKIQSNNKNDHWSLLFKFRSIAPEHVYDTLIMSAPHQCENILFDPFNLKIFEN